MASKPKFLKNILTTASALAVLAGAGNALAAGAVATTTGVHNPSATNTAGDFKIANAATVGALPANSQIIVLAGNLSFTNPAGEVQYSVNTYGNDILFTVGSAAGGKNFTLTNGFYNDISPGAKALAQAANNPAVAAPAAGANLATNTQIVFGNADSFTLPYLVNGGNTVTSVDFANSAATLNVGGLGTPLVNGTVIATNFASTGGANGTVNLKSAIGSTVTITGTFAPNVGGAGLNAINNLNLDGGNFVFNTNDLNTALGTSLTAGTTVTMAAGKNITGLVTGAAANQGILTFQGKSTVANAVGGANALSVINLGNDAVTFNGTGARNLLVVNQGRIRANAINFVNGSNLVVNGGTGPNLGTLITGNLVTSVSNKGSITVNTDTIAQGKVGGIVGSNNMYLSSFDIAAGHQLTFIGGATADGNLYVQNINTQGADGTGTLNLSAATNQNLWGNVGASGKALAKININGFVNLPDGGAVAAPDATVTTVTLNPGLSIYARDIDLTGGGGSNLFGKAPVAPINNTLVLLDSTTVTGNISSANAGSGAIVIKGNAKIVGNIGSQYANNAAIAAAPNTAGANGVGIIDLTSGGKLSISNASNITATGVQFGNADGVLEIDNSLLDVTIYAPITAANAGTINLTSGIAGRTAIFSKAVGADNNKLANINVGANKVIFADDAYTTVNMDDNADTTVVFDKAGGKYGVTVVHGDNLGTVQISDDATLTNSLVLGLGEKNPLKVLKIGSAANAGADVNVKIGDAISLYANTLDVEADKVALTFDGDANVSATNPNKLKAVTTSAAAGKSVNFLAKTLLGEANVNGDATAANAKSSIVFGGGAVIDTLNVGANSTTEFGADSTVTTINVLNNTTGSILFNNNNAMTFTNVNDQNNTLAKVVIANKDVTLAGKVLLAKSYDFTNKGQNATLTLNGIDVGASKAAFTTAAGQDNVYHNIRVNVDQNFNSAFGTATNPFGSVIVDGDKTVTITTDQFFSGVESVNKDQVTVVLAAPTGVTGKTINLNQAGSYVAGIKVLDIKENANVGYVANAREIKLAKDKIVNFTAASIDLSDQDEAATLAKSLATSNSYSEVIEIPSNVFLLSGASGLDMGANTTANFDPNSIVNSNINATVANNGTVNFKGNAYVNNLMGSANNSLAAVNFATSQDSLTALNSDIYAKNINASNGNFFIVNSTSHGVVFNGTTTLANQNIYLDNNDLVFAGNTTMTGNVTLQTALVNGELGTITVQGNNNKLDLSGVTAGSTVIVSGVKGTQGGTYDFIIAEKGANLVVPTANFNVDSDATSRRFNFTLDNQSDPSKVKITSNFTGAQGEIDAINKALPGRDKRLSAVVENIAHAVVGSNNNPSTGDAAKLSALVDDFDDIKKVNEAYTRLVQPSAHQTAEINNATNIGNEVGGTRLVALTSSNGNSLAGEGNLTAAASGDDDTSYGVWATPYYNRQNQKARNGVAGYKGTSGGAIFGFDVQPNDTALVGVAGSIVNNTIKHRDYKAGDKTKSTTYALTVYGIQQLSNNWFYQGVATAGNSSVRGTQLRVSGATTYEIAKANYNATVMSGELLTGYNIKDNDMFMATPIVGVRYSRYSAEGYKEKGTSFQNLSVTSRPVDKLEAIAGLRVAGAATDLGGLMIIPEVHAFADYAVKQNSGKQTISYNGAVNDFGTVKSNPGKFQFNGGLGATVKMQPGAEFGAGFDMFSGKKFTSYQGSLKVRVNF